MPIKEFYLRKVLEELNLNQEEVSIIILLIMSLVINEL